MPRRGTSLPRLPQLPTPPRPVGASKIVGFKIPRPRNTRESLRPYPPPPAGWLGPLDEWIVTFYLTTKKGWKKVGPGSPPIPGKSFYYQVRIPALSIFVNTDNTRVDFLIPLGYGSGGGYNTIALDPYTEFTHKDASLDRLKRTVLLQQQKILLIFIESARLEGGDFEVIESALRGRDESQRSLGG